MAFIYDAYDFFFFSVETNDLVSASFAFIKKFITCSLRTPEGTNVLLLCFV